VCCVVVCDLETSRIGAPCVYIYIYIYDISSLRVNMSWENMVSIATHYGLDSPGIISWLEKDFPDSCSPELGPTQPPVQRVLGHSPWVKWLGHRVDHPHPSSAAVKERLKLYLYSPLGLHGLF